MVEPTSDLTAIQRIAGGVYDDYGRLMMMINFNTDLGDAWEHAAEDFYPRKYSNMALKMGINAVVYTLTH